MELLAKDLDRISILCINKNISICTAESVTSGYLQFIFSQSNETLSFFEGGITTYTIEQKVKHLNIDYEEGLRCNCVSKEIADKMAINVCRLFSCNLGIAITGYASVIPEEKVCDLHAFYSIAINGKIEASGKISSTKRKPVNVQKDYAFQLVHLLKKVLERI